MSKISKAVRLQLAKMLQAFREIATESGDLLYMEGELEVGNEIFTYTDEGEMVPAKDGEYVYSDGIVTVEGGRVAKIEAKALDPVTGSDPEPQPEPQPDPEPEPEPDPEPDPEPTVDTLKARIAELEGQLEEVRAERDGLKARVDELEKKLEESVDDPLEAKLKKQDPNQDTTATERILKYIRNKKQ
jgi:hypothetical protein